MVARAAVNADTALPVAALAIVAVAAALGLASSLALLHENWTTWYGPTEHGYVVLAASVWIAVTMWRANPPRELSPDWWALLPLGALVALLAGLELMFVNNTRLLLLPPLVLAAAALVFGREAAKRLFWPAAFLYFALPQWWVINGVLHGLTTAAVTQALRFTSVPAFVDGNFVQLQSGTFEIASGCSGLNFLQAGTALAMFQGLLALSTWRNRLILLAVAAGFAVVSNWIRVYSVVVVGHFSDMQHYLVKIEHSSFGWALFMVAMVPVLMFAARLERLEGPSAAASPSNESVHTVLPASRLVVPAALATAVLLLLPIAISPAPAVEVTTSTALPSMLDDETRAPLTSGWSPAFANANEDSGSFIGGSPAVEVYRAVYPHQDRDRRLLRPSNDFLGVGFRLQDQDRRNIAIDGGVALQLTEYRGSLRERERVIWAWYWVADTQVAGGLEAKLAEFRGLLKGRRDGAAIALAADCVPNCDSALARLTAFASSHEQELRWQQETPP